LATALDVVGCQRVETEIGVCVDGGVEVFEDFDVFAGREGGESIDLEWQVGLERSRRIRSWDGSITVWLRSTGVVRVDKAAVSA
jgi:hypothetical protein